VAAGPDGYRAQLTAPKDRQKTSAALHNMLQGVMAGVYRGGQVDIETDDGNGGTAASQTVTYTAPAGAQTIVIAGRTVNFTAGADATATALAAVAAIQADSVANRLVSASSAAGVVTLKAKVLPCANTMANGATLAVTGTGAAAGGATFAGGVNSTNAGFAL
jgi:phage tail sheath gpL-like